MYYKGIDQNLRHHSLFRQNYIEGMSHDSKLCETKPMISFKLSKTTYSNVRLFIVNDLFHVTDTFLIIIPPAFMPTGI